MYILHIYIYIYSVVVPEGTTWGTPLQVETSHPWGPAKPRRGGTNTKVTSAKGHFCA